MHAVRPGISDIGKEASRQLALDIEVVLLHISILGVGMGRQRGRTVRRDESRGVGLRIASGWQKDPLSAERTTCISTRETGKRNSRQRAIGPVQGAEGSPVGICRSVEASGGQIHNVIVGVESKRYVVWNEEDAVAAADHGFLIESVGESKTWRERLLIHRNIVAAR